MDIDDDEDFLTPKQSIATLFAMAALAISTALFGLKVLDDVDEDINDEPTTQVEVEQLDR